MKTKSFLPAMGSPGSFHHGLATFARFLLSAPLLIGLYWSPLLRAAETGSIQVKCAPGIQVFLDGNLRGMTESDVGGLVLQGVPVGQHEIKAIKPGYQPQVGTLDVAAGQVTAFEAKPFVPKIKITEIGKGKDATVNNKVGSLLVHSVPNECKISIADLGIQGQAKSKEQWAAEDVPVGRYGIVVEALGKQLHHQVVIEDGQQSEIRFDFATGEVHDLVAERRAAEEKERPLREKELARSKEEALRQGITLPPGWTFMHIKPGAFTMGSPETETGRGSGSKEQPHKVTLTEEFWMSVNETTQEQYEQVMGRNPSDFKNPKNPVEQVSWNDAQDFLRKFTDRERQAGRLPVGLAYQLPTEAQWEYCCRAGTDTVYCFGNSEASLRDYAWYEANSGRKPHPVAQRKPNAWGLYDMHGNVWEWCADWQSNYPRDDVSDPVGLGSIHVSRGASWRNPPSSCRSAARGGGLPTVRSGILGFRVLLGPTRR